jgi:hypothetical protein
VSGRSSNWVHPEYKSEVLLTELTARFSPVTWHQMGTILDTSSLNKAQFVFHECWRAEWHYCIPRRLYLYRECERPWGCSCRNHWNCVSRRQVTAELRCAGCVASKQLMPVDPVDTTARAALSDLNLSGRTCGGFVSFRYADLCPPAFHSDVECAIYRQFCMHECSIVVHLKLCVCMSKPSGAPHQVSSDGFFLNVKGL